MIRVKTGLTAEKRLQTKEFDPSLPLYEIGRTRVWSTRPRPVHLTLTETHCVDIVAADLQDEASVHHIQQAVSEDPLFVISDVLSGWKAKLLQADRPKQLLLVDHGAEVSVEKPAALRVADSRRGSHLLPSVQELHLQICH